jgi:hypothetical protein
MSCIARPIVRSTCLSLSAPIFLKSELTQERLVAERPIASMLTHFGALTANPTAFLIRTRL